jgi:hypothetical protein
VGRPPGKRPVREITAGLPYHFHHTGFDHRELRRTLSETFEVERQFASPVGGELLGTEVYLILKKRGKGSRQAGRPEPDSTPRRASETQSFASALTESPRRTRRL